MVSVASRRSSVRANVTISPIIIDWNGVAPKFFSMIHDALSGEVAIDLSDFNAVAGTNLGELIARYSILGSRSNISLRADNLSFEFPSLVPGDVELTLRIMETTVTAFGQAFPGHRFSAVQAGLFDHAEILDDKDAVDYLARYAIAGVDHAFGNVKTVHQPAVRFGATAADGAWRANCTLEKSELLANGLFMNLDVVLPNVDEGAGFRDWLDCFRAVFDGCANALELEWSIGNP